MKHKDLSTESAAGTAITRKENRHYSFRHQHKHLWHCGWGWILIISFLTPQFTYKAKASLTEAILLYNADVVIDVITEENLSVDEWVKKIGEKIERRIRKIMREIERPYQRITIDHRTREVERSNKMKEDNEKSNVEKNNKRKKILVKGINRRRYYVEVGQPIGRIPIDRIAKEVKKERSIIKLIEIKIERKIGEVRKLLEDWIYEISKPEKVEKQIHR